MNKICASCLSIMLSWLLLFNGVYAAELLNLTARAEGDKTLGQNVTVGTGQASAKYVTGYNGLGQLQLPVNLTMPFEVSFKVSAYSTTEAQGKFQFQTILANADQTINIQLDITGGYSSLGIGSVLKATSVANAVNTEAWWGWKARGEVNTVKMIVKGGVVEVSFNDSFAGRLTLAKSATFTKLIFQGIAADSIKLYEVNTGAIGTTTVASTPIMKLGGISTRGRIGTDPMDYLIAGLLVQGGTKLLIVRAVSVDGIVNPRVTVKSYPAGTVLYTNNDWTAGASAANLQQIKWNPAKTTDAAMIISLAPGLYTLEVAPEGVGGVGIVEVYEYPQ